MEPGCGLKFKVKFKPNQSESDLIRQKKIVGGVSGAQSSGSATLRG
jgi:hypothetical protein